MNKHDMLAWNGKSTCSVCAHTPTGNQGCFSFFVGGGGYAGSRFSETFLRVLVFF